MAKSANRLVKSKTGMKGADKVVMKARKAAASMPTVGHYNRPGDIKDTGVSRYQKS